MNKMGIRGKKQGEFTVTRLPVGEWHEEPPFFVKITLKNQESAGSPGLFRSRGPENLVFFSSAPARPPLVGPHGARSLNAVAAFDYIARGLEFVRLLPNRDQRKPDWH